MEKRNNPPLHPPTYFGILMRPQNNVSPEIFALYRSLLILKLGFFIVNQMGVFFVFSLKNIYIYNIFKKKMYVFVLQSNLQKNKLCTGVS